MNHVLAQRLAELILAGDDFTADDLTANGAIALDAHRPNGGQNAIGSFFREASADGLIAWTGRGTKSMAPHRKGGLIRVWAPTPKGVVWARRQAVDNSKLAADSRHDRGAIAAKPRQRDAAVTCDITQGRLL